jgi:hypothetical protein
MAIFPACVDNVFSKFELDLGMKIICIFIIICEAINNMLLTLLCRQGGYYVEHYYFALGPQVVMILSIVVLIALFVEAQEEVHLTLNVLWWVATVVIIFCAGLAIMDFVGSDYYALTGGVCTLAIILSLVFILAQTAAMVYGILVYWSLYEGM